MQAIVILKEPPPGCGVLPGGGVPAPPPRTPIFISYILAICLTFTIGCFILYRILIDIWIENMCLRQRLNFFITILYKVLQRMSFLNSIPLCM